MADQRFDPIKEINNLRQTLLGGARQFPLVDIYETTDAVIIRTEPIIGLDLSTLEVSVEAETLIVRGSTSDPQKIEEQAYIQRELVYGSFERKLHIPRMVDPQQAKATYKHGIVEITLPKIAPMARGKIITVMPVE